MSGRTKGRQFSDTPRIFCGHSVCAYFARLAVVGSKSPYFDTGIVLGARYPSTGCKIFTHCVVPSVCVEGGV